MALHTILKKEYVETEDSYEKNNAFEKLAFLLEPQMSLVNQLIIQNIQGSSPLIAEVSAHLMGAGGKKLRPLLTLAASQLGSRQEEGHLSLATCIEFIHNATLLHDDVVDESFTRRGQPSANALWGNKPSILIGDFLFSRAFELMVSLNSLPVLGLLSQAASDITQGEIHQLCLINELNISKETYLDIVSKKTASLFGAACSTSALLTHEKKEWVDALYSYGYNLGIVFQLIDDILDYAGHKESLGKDTGDDFREGKATLPVLFSYEKATEEEKFFWHRTISQLEQTPEDFDAALALMKKHDSLQESLEVAQSYGNKAVEALSIFPSTDIKECLVDLVEFCLNRAF